MDICDWLRKFLKDGKREVEEIKAAAKAAGYTRRELKTAKLLCCIQTTNNWKRGLPEELLRWFWELPPEEDAAT